MDKYELYRKSVEVELFDEKFTLAERSGRDERALAAALVGKDENDEQVKLASTLWVIRDGLKINISRLSWWRFIEKLRLRKLFSNKSLIELPERLRLHLLLNLMELEGKEIDLLDSKKKTKEQ